MKKIMILTLLVLMLSAIVIAETHEENYTSAGYSSDMQLSNLQIEQLRYEPYPANPGEYLTLWIKVENVGNVLTENAVFELKTKYPFYLDASEEALREYGQISLEPIILEYKIRVDENVIPDEYVLELWYNDATRRNEDNWQIKEFEITVKEVQTDFDLVVQSIDLSEVAIAIANIGQEDANSVIVKIPEQTRFQTIGTSGQMIGNLDSGDYTLVSFQLEEKQNSEGMLNVQIDYTDSIGERRTLIKEIELEMNLGNTLTKSLNSAGKNFKQKQTSIFKSVWFWVITIVIIGIIFKYYKKYQRMRK